MRMYTIRKGSLKMAITSIKKEIYKRAHFVQGQGDGIFMITIRLDEILRAVKAARRKKKVVKRSR